MNESGNRSRSVPPPVLHRPISQEKDERNSPAVPNNDHLSERAGESMEDQQTFPSSFGELLKTHRKRKRLTQKQLAQQLGVHANTISSWELGTYLPHPPRLVLELSPPLPFHD